MTIPNYQQLMLPLLKIFASGKESITECLPELRKVLQLTEEEAAELLPSGKKTVLSDRAHWARTYMSKAGLLHSDKRGHHKLTSLGHKVISEAPLTIDNDYLSQFPNFLDWKNGNSNTVSKPTNGGEVDVSSSGYGTGSVETPEQAMLSASIVLESALREELLELLYKMDPYKFEGLIVDLLIAMGFGKGQAKSGILTPKSNDGGFDGVIHEDTLGLDAVYIQAKRYDPSHKVGSPDVQQFIGSLAGEGATKGVFVTTSDFSRKAKSYVQTVQQRVVLIDGQKLAKLMVDHEIGVRKRTAYYIKSVDEDYFA